MEPVEETPCPICGHLMFQEEHEDWNPKRQWVCLCGHHQPVYGQAEEGES